MSIIVPTSREEEVANRWILAFERSMRYFALPPIGRLRRALVRLFIALGSAAFALALFSRIRRIVVSRRYLRAINVA